MMRRSLYHIKWYFAKTDLNTDKGKAENKKSVVNYAKRYTPEKEAKSPTSFKVDFVGQPYEGACYYRITRCPICVYAEKLGVSELMPLFCELDEVMITLQHGVLHRKQTLAMLGGRKTVIFEFLGTGMISVMPVPLLSVHPRECSQQGHIRYVPSACACRWTCPVPLHKPPSQAL